MHERKKARLHANRRPVLVFVHLCALAFLMSGCAKARASSSPQMPPLNVPAPPPRAIDPVEPVDVEAPPPPPVPQPPEPARRPPPAPPRPRTPPRQAEAPKVETPAEAPKPAEEAAKPAQPPTTLQTAPAGSEADLERALRSTLARATSDLNRVDYRALNADARTQYDTAKRFVQQADEAMRAKNLVFARNLADKAAALAAQLASR